MFEQYLYYLIYFFIIIIFTGFFNYIISNKTISYIHIVFGNIGLYINSLLGTPIHEIGHLFFVILTGHKVNKIKLIPRYKDVETNKPLGYILFEQKKGIINNMFLFFMGIGPLFSCSLMILILMKLFLPETYNILFITIKNIIESDYSFLTIFFIIIKYFFINVFDFKLFTDYKFYIFLFIATSIATHMSLSNEDIKVSFHGFIFLFSNLFIFIIILSLLNINILKTIVLILSFMTIIFIISIIFSFLNYLIMRLFIMVYLFFK